VGVPPGGVVCGTGGLKTITVAVPAAEISAPGTVALMSVAVILVVTKVVCVAPAVQRTCDTCVGSDDVMKFVPCRSKVKFVHEVPHAAVVAGVIDVSVGIGLGGGLMMKVTGFDSPLLPAPENGFCVMTVAVPGLATNEAGTTAVNRVTTVPVESSVTVVFSFCPFQVTYVCFTNPLPLIVSVKSGLPALMVEGDRNVTCAPVLF
jgi:hypothetical protein